jgi:hypothetical protein
LITSSPAYPGRGSVCGFEPCRPRLGTGTYVQLKHCCGVQLLYDSPGIASTQQQSPADLCGITGLAPGLRPGHILSRPCALAAGRIIAPAKADEGKILLRDLRQGSQERERRGEEERSRQCSWSWSSASRSANTTPSKNSRASSGEQSLLAGSGAATVASRPELVARGSGRDPLLVNMQSCSPPASIA